MISTLGCRRLLDNNSLFVSNCTPFRYDPMSRGTRVRSVLKLKLVTGPALVNYYPQN